MYYISVFKDGIPNGNVESMIEGALNCMNKFSYYFEREDLVGMDACCQFPHFILSGNQVVCWEKPGQLTPDFFLSLKKQGFLKTVVDYRDVILVSENKVHLKYGYSRIAVDGTVMSKHDNVWILTFLNGVWGIQVRSY